jgi:chromosome segregation ATPase|tara:strand:+ start:2064 stop:2618 length:555 start_codon:yes stop_codon:yes gene_type:complete
MSEDKTTAVEETVSEAPATETTQDSSIGKYIAESKKYRERAQDAENRLGKLEKSLAKAEESKLKEKEEFKTLYEQTSSKVESLTSNAEKWTKYEETRRNSLLEKHPEEDRERLSGLELDTLEFVTNKINNTRANPPEVAGNPRKEYKTPPKDWTKLSQSELRESWDDIVKDAVERSKATVKTSR